MLSIHSKGCDVSIAALFLLTFTDIIRILLYIQINIRAMHAILNSFSRDVCRLFDAYFKEHKLATPFVELLIHISEDEKLSQKELSERMNLAPSTITRFIDKLQNRELVEKKMNGRMAFITLSGKGKKLIPHLVRAYHEAEETLQKKLGEKFVHTTEQLLKHGSGQLKNNL